MLHTNYREYIHTVGTIANQEGCIFDYVREAVQ